jgi:uncharacterized membrane protein
MSEQYTPERVNAFSDGVFAVIITLMVLDLKKPAGADWHSLATLWPVLLSYIVSYLFIAIVWINHHYLLKHSTRATPRLIWANFAHLFSVSFVPFLTSWIAETEFQPLPVAVYAFVFLLVNITYLIFVWETLCDGNGNPAPDRIRHIVNIRCFTTIGLFSAALVLSFWWPRVGFTIVCLCLLLYLRPEASRTRNV